MVKNRGFLMESNLMKNSNNSKIFLWSGIFSGILAVVLVILLRPGVIKKQLVKPNTSKYIDLSDKDNKSQEKPSEPKKTKPTSKSKDDLKVINGIGPKIESLLNENGILSFVDLSETKIENLRELLLKNNLHLANPESWPIEAKNRVN